MNKKFDINGTKIKGSCQSGRKVVTHDSKSDLPLVYACGYWLASTNFFFLTNISRNFTRITMRPQGTENKCEKRKNGKIHSYLGMPHALSEKRHRRAAAAE